MVTNLFSQEINYKHNYISILQNGDSIRLLLPAKFKVKINTATTHCYLGYLINTDAMCVYVIDEWSGLQGNDKELYYTMSVLMYSNEEKNKTQKCRRIQEFDFWGNVTEMNDKLKISIRRLSEEAATSGCLETIVNNLHKK